MDSKKRACLVENDEEDEDGNLSSAESEPSMGENDDEFKLESEEEDEEDEDDEEDEEEEIKVQEESEIEDEGNEKQDEEQNTEENEEQDTEENEEQDIEENEEQDTEENEDSKPVNRSKFNSAKSKISREGEAVYLHEDSSSFQPEDNDDTMNFDDNHENQTEKIHNKKTKSTVGKKNKSTSIKTQSKAKRRKISKNRKTSESSDDETSSSPSDSITNKEYFKNRFVRQPTPLCDAILKDYAASKQNNEALPEKRRLRGSKPNNNSDIAQENQTDLVGVSDQSESLQSVNKEDPISTEEMKTILPIIDPLLVKKEESDMKIEIKEEINCEYKDDLTPFSTEDMPLDVRDCDKNEEISKEDPIVIHSNKINESNKQNSRKRTKRKNEGDDEDEDPSYSPKTKKQSTLSPIKTNKPSHQQEETFIPTYDLSKNKETQSTKKRRGRPAKYQVLPLTERNKECENNLLCDEPLPNSNSEPRPSLLVKTETNSFDVTSVHFQPVVSLVSCDSLIQQSISQRGRGRPATNLKATNSVISTDIKNTQPSPPRKSGRQIPESNPDASLDGLLKTEDFIIPLIDRENVFDNSDLLCLQQLDTSVISSQAVEITGSMTAKETNSFIADYLSSHQHVFDDSFFKIILPILSEILMLCMDEFTELLARHKKAENFTTEEFRQQELKLAIQSFCTMVSTYSEKFFPNFNSVMYKIDQNKTKKGLLIALIFFIANSLCIKAPKFKGQIHSMRKMLMCMCQIKKINSPLFLTVLNTPETVFNDELRLLVKILLVLQRKNVLAIPTTALPETSTIDSLEETCELIISSSTNCIIVSDSTSKYSDIAAQFVKILRDDKQGDLQRVRENLGHILCLFKQNDHSSNSEITVKSSFDSGPSRSLTRPNKDQILIENPKQDHVGGLDSMFQSFLNSTRNSDDDSLKTELDVDGDGAALSLSYDSQSSELRLPIPADNIDGVVKVEEIDCGSLLELPENTGTIESSTVSIDVDSFIPENGEQDPLSF